MAKENVGKVNENTQEDTTMENNFYKEENNDIQAPQEETQEGNDDQQQNNQSPAVPEKEKKGIVKTVGVFVAGVALGVVGTCGFFAFRGKNAPKLDTGALTDNIVEFAKEAAKEAVNK